MKLGAKSSRPRRTRYSLQMRGVKMRGGVVANEITIARLVIAGRPPVACTKARKVLADGLRKWPDGMTAKFLLMPGGFVSESWPRYWSGRWGWDSDDGDFEILKRHVTNCVNSLVNARVRALAAGKVNSIVFGIDVGPDAATGALAELAVVYNMEDHTWKITGKSFPRGDQRRVVRINNLRSHFVEASGERVLVLGCHDLNIFSARGRSRQHPQGHLAVVRREMDHEVKRFAPTVALQLPHGTDTPRTWIPAWKALAETTGLRAWASGIAFYRVGDGPCRGTFDEVCSCTYGGEPCLDLIFENRRASLGRILCEGTLHEHVWERAS